MPTFRLEDKQQNLVKDALAAKDVRIRTLLRELSTTNENFQKERDILQKAVRGAKTEVQVGFITDKNGKCRN